jgi:hypothetical protein
MSSVLIAAGEHSEVVSIQDDLYIASLSFSALAKINIMERRRFQMQSELEESAIWTTPRNRCRGMGIIWEMPMIEVPDPAAPGPHEDLIVRAHIICDPNFNSTPDVGSQIEPELVCKYLRRFVHNWRTADHGEFVSDRKTMLDISEQYPGMLAYEENWRIRLTEPWYGRVTAPTANDDGSGNVTLVNDAGYPDADIYYTIDDSPPGKTDANSKSTLYTAPIPIASGESVVIRWGAFQDGYLPSFWNKTTVTNNS